MSNWKSVLELDSQRRVTGGSAGAFREAVRAGSDLRISTEFIHNEHIDTRSDNAELVREVSDFPVTYLIDDEWVAGIMTFRMPIIPPDNFGPRPSMSFFMYNQDGQQAVARPFLDGRAATGVPGRSDIDDHSSMPKYHEIDNWDAQTNAPSSNFVYEFDKYRFMVHDDWKEVLEIGENGGVLSGSLKTLLDAFTSGCEVKVGIRGICADLGSDMDHEVFVQTGPCYYNTQRKIFSAGARPIVRVKPAKPMQYESRGWDYGWLLIRTDGVVNRWLCDPYSRRFSKSENRYQVRWFIKE